MNKQNKSGSMNIDIDIRLETSAKDQVVRTRPVATSAPQSIREWSTTNINVDTQYSMAIFQFPMVIV